MPLSEWDPKRGRSGREWRRLVKELCPPGSQCQVEQCKYPELGRVIVFGLRHNHPHGPSLDHIIDLQYGGHPTSRSNLRPAHRCCSVAMLASVGRRMRNRCTIHDHSRPSISIPVSTLLPVTSRRSSGCDPQDPADFWEPPYSDDRAADHFLYPLMFAEWRPTGCSPERNSHG